MAAGDCGYHYLPTRHYFGRVMRQSECAGFSMLELRHTAAARLPEHSHEAAYSCLLLAGAYQETIGNASLAYRPFTLTFHPPALTHRDEIGPQGGRFFIVEYEPSGLNSVVDDGLRGTTALAEVRDARAVGLMLGLYRSYRLDRSGASNLDVLHVESLALELLAVSVRARTSPERRRPAWLTRVVEFLHDGRGESLSLAKLASEAGVHPVHLARVFRRVHGCTMGQYRASVRAQRACALLTAGRGSLARIAAEAGFADQSHFTRVFSSIVGCPPGRFRRLLVGARATTDVD